jgi:hypothetical protein
LSTAELTKHIGGNTRQIRRREPVFALLGANVQYYLVWGFGPSEVRLLNSVAAIPAAGDYSVPAWNSLARSNAETFESRCDGATLRFLFVNGGDLCFERRITQYLKMPGGVMQMCQDQPVIADPG